MKYLEINMTNRITDKQTEGSTICIDTYRIIHGKAYNQNKGIQILHVVDKYNNNSKSVI